MIIRGCKALLFLLPFGCLAEPQTAARLADAVQRNDAAVIRSLLAGRADVNAAQVDGTTALHWAAFQDNMEVASTLLSRGAKAAAVNRYGVTPLSLACTNGNGVMVERLLQAGADPNTKLPGGETVLMTAARTGKTPAVKALLAHGADVNASLPGGQNALMWAAAEGHAEVIETLIAAGADARVRLNSGYDAFLFAVREGKPTAVKALLKAGFDVNETVQTNQTFRSGLASGAGSPRAGTSALVIAVTNGHFELAAMLLDAGADPNAAVPGYTALHVISNVRKPGGGDNDPSPIGSGRMSSLDLVKKLAARGADLNARMTKRINFGLTGLNTLWATPFILAAKTADVELMRTLIALGADPLLTNADNSTPLMAAAGLGTRSPGEDAGSEAEVLEAVQVALGAGADINAVDKNGETAMHGAAYKNLPRVVQFLADKGAKIEIWNRKNKYGWTPLTIAEGHRFGNFKPSPDTVAAFRRVMSAAGVMASSGGASQPPSGKPAN